MGETVASFSGATATAARPSRRIAYASIYDASDITKWRRAGHFMARSLENAGASVEYLGPLQLTRQWMTKPKAALYDRVLNRSPYRAYYPGRDRAVVRDLGVELGRRLRNVDVEAVVSGESPFSQPVAYLDTDLPVVVWTDVTFAGVIGFYPNYSHLCRETVRHGMANEAAALRRATLVVFSSPWAADKAVDVYGLDPAKVKVANNGPGPMLEVSQDEVRAMVASRDVERCRLLFVAENWERKGGETALRLAEALNTAGVSTELLILGCDPPPGATLPTGTRPLGRIDKSTEAGKAAFRDLMGSAHFLVLPTRADCTPMVVCEAAAHGVPALTTSVGGLPWMVTEGRNGRALPLDVDISAWRDTVLELMNPSSYSELAMSSFAEYHERLNWDTQGRKVLGWLDAAVAS